MKENLNARHTAIIPYYIMNSYHNDSIAQSIPCRKLTLE